MPYIDQNAPHAGSAEVLFTSMFDEPAGTLARTMPTFAVGKNSIAPVTSQPIAKSIPLPQGLVTSNIRILVGGTSAVAPTHLWLALTDQFMNVLAVTADQGAAAITTSTNLTLALTQQFQVAYTGLYYVVCSISATTTMPTLSGANTALGTAAPFPLYCGTLPNQATPPAIGANLGALTGNAGMCLAAWIS